MTEKKQKVLGKLQPHDLEIERAIVGAIMAFGDSRKVIFPIINDAEMFYHERYKIIYKACLGLYLKLEPIDILTIVQSLKKSNEFELIGGYLVLTEIINDAPPRAGLEVECKKLKGLFLKRKLIQSTQKIQELCFENEIDINEVIDSLNFELVEVRKSMSANIDKSGSELYMETLDEIGVAMNTQDKPQGVPTGFTEVDKLTGGWQKSDLIVVAARPGMGKTTFVLETAKSAVVYHKADVAIFSLEMSDVQLMRKSIASESEFSPSVLKKGKITLQDYVTIQTKSQHLKTDNFHIYSKGYNSLNAIISKCIELKSKCDLKLIVIDYIQLIQIAKEKSSFGKNREQEISEITRNLKLLAKDLDVPIIALSQLSRQVETRQDKRPQLSDLRESGAIEQDADIVMFIYRPEYYKINEDENGNSTLNMAEVIFAKHRNGGLATLQLGCDMSKSKFFDYGLQSEFSLPQQSAESFNYLSTEFQQ